MSGILHIRGTEPKTRRESEPVSFSLRCLVTTSRNEFSPARLSGRLDAAHSCTCPRRARKPGAPRGSIPLLDTRTRAYASPLPCNLCGSLRIRHCDFHTSRLLTRNNRKPLVFHGPNYCLAAPDYDDLMTVDEVPTPHDLTATAQFTAGTSAVTIPVFEISNFSIDDTPVMA